MGKERQDDRDRDFCLKASEKAKGKERRAGTITAELSQADFCLKTSLKVLNLSPYILQTSWLFPSDTKLQRGAVQLSSARLSLLFCVSLRLQQGGGALEEP